MIIISVCAVLKSVGSLGGWMLLVGQSAKAAADDGMFPRVFARLNANGVPGRGLVIVAVLMTIVLFATMSPTLADQFNHIVNLAVILIIVPYVYSAVAVVKVIHDHKLPRRTFLHLQVDRASPRSSIACGSSSAAIPRRSCTRWWRC